MSNETKPAKSSRERARAYRERMRARGLRPVTLWVPDLRRPEIRAEIQRQCKLLAASEDSKEALRFIEEVAAWPADEPGMPDYREDEPKTA